MSSINGGWRSSNIVKDGLVLYLDAGSPNSFYSPISGSTWKDISGNVNNGTLTNGPTYDSTSGGSIVFDGVDDYVGRNVSLNVGQNFSIFSWIKPPSITNLRRAVVSTSYPYLTGQGWLLALASGYNGLTNTFFLTIGQDNSYRTAAINSITLNAWNYISATAYNGGLTIKLYVNGIETSYFGGSLTNVSITYGTNEFNIGRRYSVLPEPFSGSISNVKIYNRTLSDQEVLQNYNAQRARFGL